MFGFQSKFGFWKCNNCKIWCCSCYLLTVNGDKLILQMSIFNSFIFIILYANVHQVFVCILSQNQTTQHYF